MNHIDVGLFRSMMTASFNRSRANRLQQAIKLIGTAEDLVDSLTFPRKMPITTHMTVPGGTASLSSMRVVRLWGGWLHDVRFTSYEPEPARLGRCQDDDYQTRPTAICLFLCGREACKLLLTRRAHWLLRVILGGYKPLTAKCPHLHAVYVCLYECALCNIVRTVVGGSDNRARQ